MIDPKAVARQLELEDQLIAMIQQPRVRAALYKAVYSEIKRIAQRKGTPINPDDAMRAIHRAGGV